MGTPTASHPTTVTEALREYGCLTDDQLARLLGLRLGTTRKRMRKLVQAEEAIRVPHPRGKTGRPLSVNGLPDSGWDESPLREHQLRLNEVRLAFTHGWQDTHLRVRTWDTQGVKLETAGVQSEVRPDGIVLLEHAKAERPLVVLLEIDLGTEPLHRSGSQSCWLQKAEGYRTAEAVANWRDWALSMPKASVETACRLAVVTNSVARITGIGELMQASSPVVGVWLTCHHEIITSGPGADIWRRVGHTSHCSMIQCDSD